MISFVVRHIGPYRLAEKLSQTPQALFILLNVKGLIKMAGPGFRAVGSTGPFFYMILPGETIDFEYGPDRENWVLQLESSDFRPDLEHPENILVRNCDTWIPIPRARTIDKSLVPGWTMELQQMRECLASPLPVRRVRAELGTYSLLRLFFDNQDATADRSAEQELKHLLDDDHLCLHTLSSLCGEIGYSADHLRMLFKNRYHISPVEYRNERRMARVMELIAGSRLSIKEIAAATGFRHLSHCSANFVRAFGITPREGIRRYRHGGLCANSDS